jgi:hypothetical protein
MIIPELWTRCWLVVVLVDADGLRITVWCDLEGLWWVALILRVVVVDLRLCVLRCCWILSEVRRAAALLGIGILNSYQLLSLEASRIQVLHCILTYRGSICGRRNWLKREQTLRREDGR